MIQNLLFQFRSFHRRDQSFFFFFFFTKPIYLSHAWGWRVSFLQPKQPLSCGGGPFLPWSRHLWGRSYRLLAGWGLPQVRGTQFNTSLSLPRLPLHRTPSPLPSLPASTPRCPLSPGASQVVGTGHEALLPRWAWGRVDWARLLPLSWGSI